MVKKVNSRVQKPKQPNMPDAVKAFFQEQGRRGGKKLAAQMTPKQRTDRAKRAAAARWSKKKPV